MASRRERGPHLCPAPLTRNHRPPGITDAGPLPAGRRTVALSAPVHNLGVLDRLHDAPAQVFSDRGEVLAQNAMAVALVGEAGPGHNIVRAWFTDPAGRALFPPEDHETHSRSHVAQLRAVFAERPEDAQLRTLVGELRERSEEFDALWTEHRVALRRAEHKRFLHPVVGLLDLECEVLLSGACGQNLVIHTARPGSEAYERLQLLRMVGVQNFGQRV
ncbi:MULTISPECIES: MmyB family transcriptional regulator [unclassified Streptomyces]|uniref:MmyB family transcriptional regulator n=1 Tax=unclassified Streptomyces TaxID=2593676 RepID=UPI002B1DB990|nr:MULTISPECIES: transcriptional regulator [unclassified Streptomyces]MCX4789578.1 transcriptional regulator [Streptomyces sp. NBC_01221]